MATKFWEIFTLLLSYVVPVKSKVKILQTFVAFSEYMNFISFTLYKQPIWILNCNEILFIYFLSKYLQDKSFK